jgi:CRISPR-associated protein Csb1
MTNPTPGSLNYEQLAKAVTGQAAALRCVAELQPVGGAGDKVFPPTYEGGEYATECRQIKGEIVPCVLLDSVQSQANRMEQALLEAWERRLISLPVITVDFTKCDLPRPLRVTSLEAPHRIADALLRDSLLHGKAFRRSEVGKKLDRVSNRNATPLFQHCPTALVFGMWDSTGPVGGIGAKFARAIVSELTGLHAQVGKKTSSRIDPTQITLGAGPLYRAKEGDISWTLDEKEALRDSKKAPVKLGTDGKPSRANHGNVTPSWKHPKTKQDLPGGVTISKAIQTTVLSLPALRRLRFPLDGSDKSKSEVDAAAQVALAALGLCAAALSQEQGFDLRSRCQLQPTSAFIWELLDRPGEAPTSFTLKADDAVALFEEALAQARKAGLPWQEKELELQPSPQLAELVKLSQEKAASSVAEGVGDEG